MPKILPSIAEEDSNAKAGCRIEDPEDGFGHPNLPRGKGRITHQYPRLLPTQHQSQRGRVSFQLLSQRLCIDPESTKYRRNGLLGLADFDGPDCDIVLLLTVVFTRTKEVPEYETETCLDDLLGHNGPEDFPCRDSIPLLELRRRVQAVLGKVILLVDEPVYQRDCPVSSHW